MHSTTFKNTAAVGVLAIAILLPPMLGEFYVGIATRIAALALFAMSLDLLIGFTGLVSFGHAAFFGAAAYAVAMLAPEYTPANLLVVLPAAVGTAATLALVIGALAVRLGGVYFIMVTLAFGQMVFFIIHNTPWFGGSDGVLLFSRPQLIIGDDVWLDFTDPVVFYYTALGFLSASFALLARFVRAPFGRVIRAIRENEPRMIALGYPTYRYKLVSFVIAGAFAGLAGFLMAYQSEYVSPALLGWKESGMAMMMVILGGIGTLFGPILGAAALVLLQEVLSEYSAHWMGIMGAVIIIVVLFFKRGLAGILADMWRKRQDPTNNGGPR